MNISNPSRRAMVSAALCSPLLTRAGFASQAQAAAVAEPVWRSIWSLPMDQATLDKVRPGPAGALRSTFQGYDSEFGETGVDIFNDQVRGLKPFVFEADGRVHLRCLPLPSPIKDSHSRMKAIGQARLIAPTQFCPGDLIEVDVAHVVRGWLIAPWTTGERGWPAGGEIDMEYRPDWCDGVRGLNLAAHYPGAPAAGLGGIIPLPDVDMSKPHLRSLEWTLDGSTIIARVNGTERQRWPMLWNGKPQIVICQATAYKPLADGQPLPEISLGRWTHHRRTA